MSSLPNPATLSLEDKVYNDAPQIINNNDMMCCTTTTGSTTTTTTTPSGPTKSSSHTLTLSHTANPSSALDALAMACIAQHDSATNNAAPSRTTTTTISSSVNHLMREGPSTTTSTLMDSSNNKPFEIHQNDVLCGRGGLTNHHPGNVFFRRLVRLQQETYLKASKREKAGVAREIVQAIRAHQGRFLKKVGNEWVDIGDRKAREKTSQALREGAPELRTELQQNIPTLAAMIVAENNATSKKLPTATAPPPPMESNRARIVSDDSVVGIQTLYSMNSTSSSSSSSTSENNHATPHVVVAKTTTTTPATLYPSNHAHFIVGGDTTEMVGQKRKLPAQGNIPYCGLQEQQAILRTASNSSSGSSSRNDSSPKRGGPRLKLLKSRVMEPYCV